MKWTEKDIPSLTGKIAIVTGANSGLGFETTLALAKHGCKVIMACRNLGKAIEAKLKILQVIRSADIDIELVNLSDLGSITTFCTKINTTYPAINLLINNAGVLNIANGKTKDGFELVFGTNHFGTFALTNQLLPALAKAEDSRIVTVSSGAHHFAKIDFDDFKEAAANARFQTYAKSKLANLLFAFELDRRLQNNDIPIKSLAAHPGFSTSHLSDANEKGSSQFLAKLVQFSGTIFAQSAAKGSLPILYAATNPSVKSGEFYGPDSIGEIRGNPKLVKASNKAYDKVVAEKLWEVSEALTGVKLPITTLATLPVDKKHEVTFASI